MNGGEIKRLKELIYKTYSGVCQKCGIQTNYDDKKQWGNSINEITPGPSYPTVQHIVPLSRGGTWDNSNLTLFCNKCNQLDNRQQTTNNKQQINEY